MGDSFGWRRVSERVWRGAARHLPFVLVCVAMAAKQHVILGQIGRALHSGGARLVLSTLGAMMLAAPLARAREGRRQVLALLAVDLGLTALSYGDLLHYRAFGSLTSVTQLSSIGQLVDVREAVFALARAQDLFLFAEVPVLLAALVLPRAGAWMAVGWKARAATAVCGAVVIALVWADSPRFASPWNGRSYLAGDIGLTGYHALEAWDFAKRTMERSSAAGAEPIANAAARLREGCEARPTTAPVEARRNLILLQVESFQGFAAGLELEGQKVTPRFDALGEESLVFDRFFHVTAKGRTSDAQFASNCSLLPSELRPVAFAYAGNEFRCLPAILASAGWTAHSFQPLAPDFWNASTMDRRMGFAASHSAVDFVTDEKIGMGISDRAFLRQVATRLEALPEPFYANVLTVTSHVPFDWENLPRELRLGALEGTKVGHFLHAIHYTDGAIGEFLDTLRTSGLLDRSVLVVFGDHDGWRRKNSNLSEALPIDAGDEARWFEEEQRVAMAIRLPERALLGRNGQVGSQLDIAPTVVGLLGLPRDDTWFMGRDLLAPAEREPVAVFPDGSALSADRSFLAGGVGPDLCLEAGEKVPLERCTDLRARAQADVRVARDVLDGDLIPKLAAAGGGIAGK